MYAIDFNYDGITLSDYGFIICDFNPSDGANVCDDTAPIEFSKVSYQSGKKWGLANTSYSSCIQITFDVCKNPDVTEPDQMQITDDEYRNIVRWLNRREFKRLFFIYDDNENRDFRYYNVSFNVAKIKIAEVLCGIRLTMETDKPFAYGEEQLFDWTVSNSTTRYKVTDLSDEIGTTYPTIKIICSQAGDMTVYNDRDNKNVVIKNCSVGEIISIDGSIQTISTSLNSHKIQNDFNYEFPKIINTFDNRDNYFRFSLPCAVELSYTPIIKDVPNI